MYFNISKLCVYFIEYLIQFNFFSHSEFKFHHLYSVKISIRHSYAVARYVKQILYYMIIINISIVFLS